MNRTVLVLATLLTACVTKLEVPAEARLSCDTNAHCPAGFDCVASQCVPRNGNQPPTVSIGTIVPSKTSVLIPIIVFDAESDVTIVTVALGRGPGAQDLGLLATVNATPSGTALEFSWDAVAFFAGNSSRAQDLVVTVTPRDAFRVGAKVTSQPFAFGNNPPRITALGVATDEGVARGSVVVSFNIVDDNELVRVRRFTLHTSGNSIDVPLDSANFPEGALTSIPSDLAGHTHTLVWNTGISAALVDPAVSLEIEVEDALGDASVAAVSATFALNNAPTLQAELHQPNGLRFLNAVPVWVTITDPNQDNVSVTAEYRTNRGAWHPATPSSPALLDIESDGLPHLFEWDALGDAQTSPDLVAALGDTNGDGLADTPVVSFRVGVELRFVATNSAELSTEPVVVGPTMLGDDAPSAVLEPVGDARRDVTVPLVLSDTAGDSVDLELEFCWREDALPCAPDALASMDGWRRAQLAFGVLQDVPTGQSVEYILVWASSTPLDDDASLPQGLGQNSVSSLMLRARASNRVNDTTVLFGAWNQVPSGQILNQTPPRIVDASLRRLGVTAGVAPVAIDYTLVDDERDVADIACEFSSDGEAPWTSCREYMGGLSEGRYDLATSALDLVGNGGVLHRFIWDPTGHVVANGAAVLRLRATDGFGETSTLLSLPKIVALPDEDAPLLERTDEMTTGVASPNAILPVDLDGDGHLDLVAACGAANGSGAKGIAILRGDGTSGPGRLPFAVESVASVGYVPLSLATGDFDDDGIADVVVAGFPQAVDVFFGGGSGAGNRTLGAPHSLGHAGLWKPTSVLVADLNHDAIEDVVVGTTDTQLSIWLGNGVAGVGDGTFASQPVLVTGTHYETVYETNSLNYATRGLAACDLNADGNVDLISTNNGGMSSGTLSLFLGVGDGTFAAKVDHALTASWGDFRPSAVACADFDRDGKNDVITTGFRYGGVGIGAVLYGMGEGSVGNGTLGEQVEIPVYYWGHSLAVGDINNDGILDLASATTHGGYHLMQGTKNRTAPFETLLDVGLDINGNMRHAVAMADTDGDAVVDVVVTESKSAKVWIHAAILATEEAWSTTLVPYAEHLSAPSYTPTSLFSPNIDRFGQSREAPSFSLHATNLQANGTADFTSALQRHISQATAGAVTITQAWRAAGHQHVARVRDVLGDYRFAVRNTLGERVAPESNVDFDRVGLDLSSEDFSSQRGVVVPLLIEPSASNAQVQNQRVRVFLAAFDYARVAEWLPEDDALAADDSAGRFLPRVAEDETFRDVTAPTITWREIPRDLDNNFTTGNQTGARFVLDTPETGPRYVHVLTDQLGIFQAFLAPGAAIELPTIAAQNALEPVSISAVATPALGTTLGAYTWTQLDGTDVDNMTGANTLTLQFDAPDVAKIETLTFEFAVTDSTGARTTQTVDVEVVPVAHALAFSVAPASVGRNAPFGITVTATNGLGMPIENGVTVSLTTVGGTGTLNGSLSAELVDFAAEFSGLSYSRQEIVTLQAQADAATTTVQVNVGPSTFPTVLSLGSNWAINRIVADGEGLIVAGQFYQELVLDLDNVLSAGAAGDYDGFIARLGADGSVNWVVQLTDVNDASWTYQNVVALTLDQSGNVIAAVQFNDSMRFNGANYSPGTGQWNQLVVLDSATGDTDVGAVPDRIQGWFGIEAMTLANVGGTESLVVLASAYQTIAFPDTPGRSSIFAPNSDALVEFYNWSTRKLSTTRHVRLTGTSVMYPRALAVLGESVFVAGTFYGTVSFGAPWGLSGPAVERAATGNADAFILALDAAAAGDATVTDYLWMGTIGAAADGEGSGTEVRGLAIDGTGTLHLAGNVYGDVDFDFNPSPAAGVDHTEQWDVFVAGYTAAGVYQGHALLSGPGYESCSGLVVDTNNVVWVSGNASEGVTLANGDVPLAAGNVAFLAGFTHSGAAYSHQTTYAWPGSESAGTNSVKLTASSSHIFFLGSVYVNNGFTQTWHLDGLGGGSAYTATSPLMWVTRIQP